MAGIHKIYNNIADDIFIGNILRDQVKLIYAVNENIISLSQNHFDFFSYFYLAASVDITLFCTFSF